jgi:hypothetical protein
VRNILEQFAMQGNPVTWERYGNGHINKTYKVVCDTGEWYVLQMINNKVFKDVPALMRNIQLVTEHLSGKVDDPREVLTIVPTIAGQIFYTDESGNYWRVYQFVRNSVCLERAGSAANFFESAVAFGKFQNRLSDFPAEVLSETIPRFHDTVSRFDAFKTAVTSDPCGRVKNVPREIETTWRYEEFASILVNLQANREIPLRVTHNDSKLNNVLFDAQTLKALCVVDLDTVMPGLAVNDYGDSIRFGASTAAEDEKDLSKVWIDLDLFTAYTEGFISACGKNLTKLEIELLPVGAKMMTLECGIRFLTDYLNGDTYFKIQYPEQNLDRCRTQYKQVADMDDKWAQLNRIVTEAAKKLI